MRQINEIILHCSATREGKAFTLADIDRWHRERGWKGCGYHYVVGLDGVVEEGRSMEEAGAHCAGRNSSSIGICYIGGCDLVGKAKDTRTEAQKAAMVKLVRRLMVKHILCAAQLLMTILKKVKEPVLSDVMKNR